MAGRAAAGLAALVALTGCTLSASYDGSRFRCDDDRQLCPEGLVCVDGYCAASEPGGDAGTPLPSLPIGNLVTYTFDDPGMLVSQVKDRSGSNHHAHVNRVAYVSGAHGRAISMVQGDSLLLFPTAQHIDVYERTFTFEAWLNIDSLPASSGALWTNDRADMPGGSSSIEVLANGGVQFTTADGGTVRQSSTDAGLIEPGVWNHLAVVWDGSQVTFYTNAELAAQLEHARIAGSQSSGTPYQMGVRVDGTRRLLGAVDEVKLSDYAKDATEIAESMEFDSTAMLGRCGDEVSDQADEICDGQTLCCDAAQCLALDDDSVCSAAGGSCQSGVCEGVDAGRTMVGLQALWLFDAITDAGIADVAGLVPPIDLSVASSQALSQQPGFVRLVSPTALTANDAGRLAQATKSSSQLTVEAWVRPANLVQDGPARVVTMSSGTDFRNFTVGQEGEHWIGRVRVSGNSGNGHPSVASGPDGETAITHVVVTAIEGERRLYVDGLLRDLCRVDGDFTGWSEAFPLVVGNEFSGNRPWLGDLHLIAIYDRALTELEVAQNYAAGPNPEL